MGTGGMVGRSPLVNFKLTPHHKNFKWFTVGGTSIKISNWGDKIIKIAEKFTKNFVKSKKMVKKFFYPHTIPPP